MVNFKDFSRLKNIFSRIIPLNSFNDDKDGEDYFKPFSSDELLEMTVKNCSKFKYVLLTAIYHLINTNNQNNEYLTVLSKSNQFVVDLIEGKGNSVTVPNIVKSEGKKNNILVACHNHFFGAISLIR
jgi:hypothetical protein